MRLASGGGLRHHADFVELAPSELHALLRVATKRDFDHPLYDAGLNAAWLFGGGWPTQDEMMDLLASLARYLRVPWEYLEQQTLVKLLGMSRAMGRLLRLENGQRNPLDPNASSEDNR